MMGTTCTFGDRPNATTCDVNRGRLLKGTSQENYSLSGNSYLFRECCLF